MLRPPGSELRFSRSRVLVWVCDVEGSTAALNSPSRVQEAEEFLTRLYWLSERMAHHTGATVMKWTGDGFLAAYTLPLDRDLAAVASTMANAAWHLSYLVNVTSLAVTDQPFLRLRHGMASDRDAIIIESGSREAPQRDVIGRGVVFATRLAALRAPFPNCVMHGDAARAARDAQCRHTFRRRKLSAEQVTKYFKGERKWTDDVHEMCDRPRRHRTAASAVRGMKRTIASIDSNIPPAWLPSLMASMDTGPRWAQDMKSAWIGFTRTHMLGAVVAAVEAFDHTKNQ